MANENTTYYKTVEEWKAAGSPEGTETESVIIGTPPKESETPEPISEIVSVTTEKPDFTTPQTLETREEELRQAIEYSERVASGEEQLPPDTSFTEYQKSVEGIKADYGALQQAKQIEESYREVGVAMPPETERYVEQVKAIAMSPFVQISPEGKVEITAPLTTIEKAGVPLSELEKAGFEPTALEAIKRQEEIIAELSKYPDLPTAVREGKIDLLREAADLGMIDKLAIVDAQIIASEIPRQQLLALLPPTVITVEDGKESLNPIVAGKAAEEGKLHAQSLRLLGYDISDEELAKWAKISTALDQVKIKVTEVRDSEFGSYQVTTTGYNYIDAVKKGLLSADDLGALGFEPEDISTIVKTASLETKLEPYKKTTIDWMSPTFEKKTYTDIGQALVDKTVAKAELIDLGYAEKDLDKAEVYSKQGLKVWIPVYGTIVTWGVASAFERGISVVGDVLLIVPTVGWLGKAGSTAMKLSEEALAVGIAKEVGVLGRVGATAKAGLYATEQLAVAPITFPVQVITSPKVALKGLWEVTAFPFAHPLETAKGIGAITTGKAFLGEPMTLRAARYFTTAAIPEAAVAIPTKGTGVQRVFTDTLISRGIPPKEADRLALEATQAMQIRLSDMVVRGEPIPKTIEIPGPIDPATGQPQYTIKFDQDLLMRELGMAISSTPFAGRIFAGAAEPTPNKVWFSTAMSPEWTGVTARGYTTPEAIELGRGGAIVKEMRINRLFDPVSKTYRNSVELEMTTAEGTQLVTSREQMLDVLKASGNAKVYPSRLMPQTKSEDIIGAIRASEGKQFAYKPVNFDEVKSLPKGSGKAVEEFVRTNDIMVGGSASERTWTDTIHLPEDIDLISLKNTAKLDAERFAKLLEGFGEQIRLKTPKEVGKEVYRIERLNPKTKEWEQVTDILDYRVHKTYNPDILNREPILDNGIKIEHPLEQAERITAKYTEYQEGVPIEQHRGHPKRLAWMAEKILDTPGGKLTLEQTNILEVVGTRIDYPEVPISKIIRMKIGGLRDAVIDEISKVIPALRRGVRVVAPDGRTIEVPRTAADELQSFIKNNPKATSEEINEVANRGIERIIDESIARKVSEGTFRTEIERIAETDPILRELPKDKLDKYINEIESQEIYKLHRAGRFTIDDVKGMVYSGVIGSGTARAIAELAREVNDRTTYERLSPILRELPKPEEELIREYPALREVTVTLFEERALEEPYKLEEPYIPEIPYVREEGILPREGMPLEEPYIAEIPREGVERLKGERLELDRLEREKLERDELKRQRLDLGKGRRERLDDRERLLDGGKILKPKGDKEYEEQVAKIQPGTVVWVQGRPLGKGGEERVAMWKVLPPPYRQEDFFTMRETPPRAVDEGWSGKGMAKKSLQIIGGLPPNNIENIDLGWARINIKVEGGKPEIEYVHDEEANVGERSQTVGMGKGQIPLEAWEEAKAQGISYEDFIKSYSGGLVDSKVAPFDSGEVAVESQVGIKRTTQEPKVVWIDSWRDVYGVDIDALAQYDSEKNAIYAIRGKATSDVIEHEKYHAIKASETGGVSSTIVQEVAEELEAEKYAYEKTGQPEDITDAVKSQIAKLASEYKINPVRAIEIIKAELLKLNPPQQWIEQFNKEEQRIINEVIGKELYERVKTKPMRVPGSSEGLEIKSGEADLEGFDVSWDEPDARKALEELRISSDVLGKVKLPAILVSKDADYPVLSKFDEAPSGFLIVIPASSLEKVTETDYELGEEARDDIQRMLKRYLEIIEVGANPTPKELDAITFAFSGGDRKVDRMLDTFAGVERQEAGQLLEGEVEEVGSEFLKEQVSEKSDALWGKPILDIEPTPKEEGQEELPATVVRSYIRRKKPKNFRNWWASAYYENAPVPERTKGARDVHIGERTYFGHRLLPPELGVEL